MKNYFGLTGLQVYKTCSMEKLNEFLLEHDGDIIDIQVCSFDVFCVIYKIGKDVETCI